MTKKELERSSKPAQTPKSARKREARVHPKSSSGGSLSQGSVRGDAKAEDGAALKADEKTPQWLMEGGLSRERTGS